MSEEVLNKLIVDVETGEQFIVPLTAAEIAQRDQDIAAYQEAEAERVAEQERIEELKVSAKAKLVAGEPLTEEEAGVMIL
jgi:uncharacterized coiled-coil DUF342 family protein